MLKWSVGHKVVHNTLNNNNNFYYYFDSNNNFYYYYCFTLGREALSKYPQVVAQSSLRAQAGLPLRFFCFSLLKAEGIDYRDMSLCLALVAYHTRLISKYPAPHWPQWRRQELYSAGSCLYVISYSLYMFPCLFRLHMVRLMLLERLLQTLPQLRNVGGVRAIPYMQVSLNSPGSTMLLLGYSGTLHFFRALRRLVFKLQKDGLQPELQVAALQVIAVVRGCPRSSS